MPDWHTDNPEKEGWYIVTVLEPMMFDFRTGAHSYAYEVRSAYFEGGGWSLGRVVAWMESPLPYVPERKEK